MNSIIKSRKTLIVLMAVCAIKTAGAAEYTSHVEREWLLSPEYSEFLRRGGEKSEDALKARQQKISEIALKCLAPFFEGVDERIRERTRLKVNSYPANIKAILCELSMSALPLITDKSQKRLNKFNGALITYIDQVYYATGKAEKSAESILNRFPEFIGTELQNNIIEIGKNIDSASKNYDEAKAWQKINEMLKTIPRTN